MSNFSFRKLEQLIEMVKHNEEKAEDMFCHSFKQDKILSLVCELMKLPIPVKFQAEKFKEETGCSTRKYYRLKTRINDEN